MWFGLGVIGGAFLSPLLTLHNKRVYPKGTSDGRIRRFPEAIEP
jgi:hypothetical protein